MFWLAYKQGSQKLGNTDAPGLRIVAPTGAGRSPKPRGPPSKGAGVASNAARARAADGDAHGRWAAVCRLQIADLRFGILGLWTLRMDRAHERAAVMVPLLRGSWRPAS
jgi:hypothetical protein